DLGLTVESDESSFTTAQNVTGVVQADDINRPVKVELVDDSGDVVQTETVTVDSDGSVAYDFETVDAATGYTVNATDVNTGVTAHTAPFNVTQAGDGVISFSTDSKTVPQGDIAEFTVNFEGKAKGSTGYVIIGNEAESGYQLNLTATDVDNDGKVTFTFNTYTAGTNGNIVEVVDTSGDKDTVTVTNKAASEQQLSSILDQGTYRTYGATTKMIDPDADAQSVGTLFLAERKKPSVTTWTAPATSSFSFDANEDGSVKASDISSLVESGKITKDSKIVRTDHTIFQIQAEGLEGMLASQAGSTQLDRLKTALSGSNTELNLKVKQTNPVANQDPRVIDIANASNSNLQLVTNENTSTYYLIFKQATLNSNVKDGDKYKAQFNVTDDYLFEGDSDAVDSANASFETLKGEVTFAKDTFKVNAAKNQTISGSSTYAPGTTFSVRVSSATGTQPAFIKPKTVTVQADGSWSASYDFTTPDGINAGDTFTVSTSLGSASADGEVIEGTPKPTTSAGTTSTTSTTEPPTTTTSTTSTTEPPQTSTTSEPPATTTTTTTPGFTAVLGIVALLGAALLAIRRD
uniref:DUF7827 domain-containing protein n=1 Tax=Halobaculum sp. P14 TaxID=3421638 RepID=UPI003EB9F68F